MPDRASASPGRRGLLAKLHIAAKALGLQEDDYRGLLTRITGHRSARNCSNSQLEQMVLEFERLGFRSIARHPRAARYPGALKARALWISLYAPLGVIVELRAGPGQRITYYNTQRPRSGLIGRTPIEA